jgi:hypothetical protein
MRQVTVLALVIAGDHDTGRGSVKDLAAVLPRGRLRIVHGGQYTALTSRELAEEVAGFLASPGPS